MKTFLKLMTLWVGVLALQACTRLEQAAAPVPQPGPGGPVALVADAAGQASLPLEALGISRRAPFTLSSEGFRYGHISLSTDSTLIYLAFDATANWQEDTGTVRVCQGGACVDRTLRVRNGVYRPQAGPTVYLGRTLTIAVVPLASQTLENLPGLSETGARIDSVWGALHTTERKSDSLRITYASVDGLARGYNLGWDEFYYRVRRPAGAGYYVGKVRVVIPDTTSFPEARPDRINGTTGNDVVLDHSQLYANDLSVGGAAPASPVLRLHWRDYADSVITVSTRYGEVKDSLQKFYYKRLVPSAQKDSITYYLQEGSEDRITRSQVYLSLP